MNKTISNNIYKKPLILRLAVYLIAVAAPLVSPSIVQGYDLPGIGFYFILIPVEIVLGYIYAAGFPSSFPLIKLGKQNYVSRNLFFPLTALLLPLLFCILPDFPSMLGKAYIFVFVIFVFNISIFKAEIISLLFVEPCFIYFIFYKLLDFSRASDSIWKNNSYIIPLFYLLLIVLYLFLSVILYAGSWKGKLSDIKKEIIAFFILLVPLVILASIFIPADYITNEFILNFRNEKVFPSGNGISELDKEKSGSKDDDGKLSGIPAERWGSRSKGGNSGKGKQYAVMVVSSEADELYSAWDYSGLFHPARGFIHFDYSALDSYPNNNAQQSQNRSNLKMLNEKELNNLRNLKLLETWRNPYNAYFYSLEQRDSIESFFVSALQERVVPYLPYSIEPTIYTPERYPFAYTYKTLSLISPINIDMFENITLGAIWQNPLKEIEPYLEIELSEKHKKIFMDYLSAAGVKTPAITIKKNAVTQPRTPSADNNTNFNVDFDSYKNNILAILKGFYSYQYELGFDEDVSVEKLSRFIEKEFPGDCSEFSNSAALLARLAGIPSRVVTGYLASRSLQTPQHLQALVVLKQSLDVLADIPLEELILVTTAHKHSWVQFYLPEYGWVDFETTQFAIPPAADFNSSADVVIPIIRDVTKKSKGFVFPWKLALSFLFLAVVLIVAALYIYKIALFSVLAVKSLKPVPVSYVSRYKYILHRLFIAGYPLKTKSMTPVEYSGINSVFADFANAFTEIFYRKNYDDNEYSAAVEKFKNEYIKLHKLTKPKNFLKFIKSIFSLRGVFY